MQCLMDIEPLRLFPDIPGLADHSFGVDNHDDAMAPDRHLSSRATGRQPRSLRSIARSKRARSHFLPSIWSFVLIFQTLDRF